MHWIGIIIILVFLWMFWRDPSECFKKDSFDFSFLRYIAGSLMGTAGIALVVAATAHLGLLCVAIPLIGFAYSIQNRSGSSDEWDRKWEERRNR